MRAIFLIFFSSCMADLICAGFPPCTGQTRIAVKTFARKLAKLGPFPGDIDVASLRNELIREFGNFDTVLRTCTGVFNREYVHTLRNGTADKATVNNFIVRAIPHTYDYQDCENSTESFKPFVANLVKEGIFDVGNFTEVVNRAREKSGLNVDDYNSCKYTWASMYRVAFKEAGLYHGDGRDWFDSFVGYDWSLKEATSSEEI